VQGLQWQPSLVQPQLQPWTLVSSRLVISLLLFVVAHCERITI
jgi:hypothetical protein